VSKIWLDQSRAWSLGTSSAVASELPDHASAREQ
jgi:hypothetical protein